MFKYLFEFILVVIIIFFVWNTLKRIFFFPFYQGLNRKEKDNNYSQEQNKNSKKNMKQNLKWDAETIDYEEIKDDK